MRNLLRLFSLSGNSFPAYKIGVYAVGGQLVDGTYSPKKINEKMKRNEARFTKNFRIHTATWCVFPSWQFPSNNAACIWHQVFVQCTACPSTHFSNFDGIHKLDFEMNTKKFQNFTSLPATICFVLTEKSCVILSPGIL